MFAGALAFVLLGFATLLAVPQTAHAQAVKEVFSGSMTTAPISATSTTAFGFRQGTYGSLGTLTDRTIAEFKASGASTDRFITRVSNDNASGGTLDLSISASGSGETDLFDTAAFNARLTFHVGTVSFAGADATRTDTGNSVFAWTSSGLTWAASQTIAVRLTLSVPGIDSIAFNDAGTDGAYAIGDAVTATVTFNEAVTVTGTPQLKIDVAGSEKTLSYASGSGTAALVFSGYTVAANDVDADGISVEANKLTLNSGTIKASADAKPDAVLTHAAVAASSSHKVDGVKPTMVTMGAGAPAASSDGLKIVLTFSEIIRSVDDSKITLMSGTNTLTRTGTQIDPATQLRLELTLTTALTAADTMVTVELDADAVTDVPGNGIAAVSATSVSVNVDSAPGAPALTAAAKNESIELTWTVSDHGSSDITKFEYRIKETTGGTYPATWTDTGAAASNTGGSATIGSLTNGTQYTVQVRGVNSVGNGANSNEPTATPDAPPEVDSVAITSDPGTDKTYIIGDDIVVTFTFDKNITISGSGSEPYMFLDVGTDEREPTCTVGTAPTKELVCSYTVVENDEDTNGVEVGLNLGILGKMVLGPLGQQVNRTHSGIAAAAGHKVDGVKPTLSSANASGDLTKVVLTFSEAIGTVDRMKITVKKGGTTQTTTGAAIDSTDSTKVEITLMTAFLSTDTNITVELDADAVTDVPGNGIDAVSSMAVSLVDNTAPTFVSAGTSGTDKVVLTYSEALDTGSQPATSAFTVEVGGVDRGVDTVAISGRAVTLTLASAFRPGDALTVSYAKPGSNPIKDAANNEAVSLAETTVTNNLAATAPEAPGGLSADFDEISTAPLRLAADILELSWVTPWHNGSPIEKYQYRYAAGSSVPPSTTWTDVPGGANEIGLDVTGLDADTEYTFEVRAKNGIGYSTESAVTRTTPDPAWSFTLRDSSNTNVTQLVEGGDSATATVSITNNVRFSTAQEVTLKWADGVLEGISSLIQGVGGTTLTIPALGTSGSLEISAPQGAGDLFRPSITAPLTAIRGDVVVGEQVGESIDLTVVDDEEPPVLTISLSKSRITEGEATLMQASISRAYTSTQNLTIANVTGATNKFPPQTFGTGNPVVLLTFPAGLKDAAPENFTSVDNSTAGDHGQLVFTIPSNPDYYTIGSPSSVTLTVLDDDAAPTAPRNLAAQAGDGSVALTWDLPTSYDTTEITAYELRYIAGNTPGGTFAEISTNANTTSHTVTGLTNGTEYTFEVQAKNDAGPSPAVSVTKTPNVGVAVSFAAASLSVDEGDLAPVTLTLAEAPAAGTTVTVPIVATGAVNTDVVNVPSSVTFAAGETSKTLFVTTVEDTFDEPDPVLTLSLGTLPDGYVPGTHATFVLTVVDDDDPIVSVTFGAAAASAPEGGSAEVTVGLSQAPEREVVLPIVATRGANLAAEEYEGVPADVTFAADETSKSFTVTFADDAVEEGNETLTLDFGTRPERVTQGANPQLVLTVTDDDGPPAAPDVSAQTGDGYVTLSWTAVSNDSPVLRYEVRWRETDAGTFGTPLDVGLVTRYRVEGLTNGTAYEFEVRAVNAHGDGEAGSAPGTPTARLTGIPKAVQVLQVKATDSARAELNWTRPANATDKVTRNSASAPFSQIQGYRIEVCRTPCDEEANWYAVVPNTRAFEHKYVHQVLAPGVIRENHYRVQAININGKTGPWSNVATLDPTVVESFRLQTPDDSTLWLRFRVLNPDGNKLYVRYENTGTGAVAYTERRLTKKGDVTLDLTGLDADSWYRVDVDFDENFGSSRMQSRWYGTARAGETPLRSPYAVDALDAQVFAGGVWRDAPDRQLYVRMGGTGRYRVRLKPCSGIHDVIVNRIQSPAGRLRASPMDVAPSVMTNLSCESEFDDWRRDENGDPFTMDQIYDMTNFPDRANDRIPLYAGTPNNWKEVTVTARALEDYPADRRYDALLSAPFAVVYNHSVHKEVTTTSSYLVSEGTGLVRILVDRPADAVLPVPTGVAIADPVAGGFGNPVMSWNAVSGATGYLVEWRHGVHYSDRANQNRSLQTATSVTLPLGGSGRGPITARVRAYSSSGVSAWSDELTWDSRPPTLNVFDTAVNEDDGSVGFLVTLSPAASGTVTVGYATVDGTAVAGTDYTATSGTLTFAPGETRKSTALVPIADDDEEDSGETFRLVLSNPAGSDANNGAAVLGDAEAVATILNSEQEPAELTGFTLVDAGTNGDLMVLAEGSTVRLGELLAPSYGIRAEMGPGAAPGSVRLELTGVKTVTRIDDAAPWSLYGDGAGRVNGAGLPPGSYTLTGRRRMRTRRAAVRSGVRSRCRSR